jgi:hypothetical protein
MAYVPSGSLSSPGTVALVEASVEEAALAAGFAASTADDAPFSVSA